MHTPDSVTPETQKDPIGRLVASLDLEAGGPDDRGAWIGHAGSRSVSVGTRIFGGLVVAQSIIAAGRGTDRQVHSVQQVFMRPGQAHVPLHYEVESMFEGRTFATVRVAVWQNDEMISHAQIGLSSAVGGLTHMEPMRSIAGREGMDNRDRLRGHRDWEDQPFVSLTDGPSYSNEEPRLDLWLRPASEAPTDQLVQRALLGYVSDRTMLATARKPHGTAGDISSATLNHAIWFHEDLNINQWLAYRLASPMASNSRGMIHGQFWTDDGQLIASTAQEGTVRLRRS